MYMQPFLLTRCWCGRAGTDLDRHDVLSMEECAYPCTGDDTSVCGGRNAFQAFEFGALAQPEGYLGCFTDNVPSRVFGTPFVSTGTNTAEVGVVFVLAYTRHAMM